MLLVQASSHRHGAPGTVAVRFARDADGRTASAHREEMALAPDTELLRLPITFVAADGSVQHSPFITARFGETETLLVLDTGSEVHLLTKELSDIIGLMLAEGEEGVDHSGATMPSWTAGSVPMSAGGATLSLDDVVVIPAPGPFPGWGVGGILSPQHLRTDATAVLDLVDDELLLVAGAAREAAERIAARHPGGTLVTLPRDGRSATPVISAALDGFPPTPTLVNSGGRHTEFDVDVVPGLVHATLERLGGGVSGSDVMGSVVGPRTVLVGDARLAVPDLALRSGMGYPGAMLGMDVLRGTVVACDARPDGDVLIWLPGGVAVATH